PRSGLEPEPAWRRRPTRPCGPLREGPTRLRAAWEGGPEADSFRSFTSPPALGHVVRAALARGRAGGDNPRSRGSSGRPRSEARTMTRICPAARFVPLTVLFFGLTMTAPARPTPNSVPPTLTREQASAFARLALAAVRREY